LKKLLRICTTGLLPDRDDFSGALSLQTFPNGELSCWIRASRQTHRADFILTQMEIWNSVLFKNALAEIRGLLGERTQRVHARVIWFKDEKRLLSCTSTCTAGLPKIRLTMDYSELTKYLVEVRSTETNEDCL